MGAGSISEWMRNLKKRIYMININHLKEKFKPKLILNENLSKYSWFNLGGMLKYFLDLDSKLELINFIKS